MTKPVNLQTQTPLYSRETHVIPRNALMLCPACRRPANHQVVVYPDFDACTCTLCNHHWNIRYDDVGREDFYVSQERLTRTMQMVADLADKLRGHHWSKNLGARDRDMVDDTLRALAYMQRQLSGFMQEVSETLYDLEREEEQEEGTDPRTVSARSLDYPWLFRRTHKGRIFQGVAILYDLVEAKSYAKVCRTRFRIEALTRLVPPSAFYPERFVILLPRDALGPVEDERIGDAKKWLEIAFPTPH